MLFRGTRLAVVSRIRDQIRPGLAGLVCRSGCEQKAVAQMGVAFRADGDEFRTVFKLPPGCEQTNIDYDQPLPEPIENSVEVMKSNLSKPRIISKPAVKFDDSRPSKLFMAYSFISAACLSYLIAFVIFEFVQWAWNRFN